MKNVWRWAAVAISAVLWAQVASPVAGAGATDSGAQWSPSATYVSPVAPMRVWALADLPSQPWLAGHRGLDIRASPGQAVHASAGGVVSFVGTVVDRPVVTIRHDDGALSSVEPVGSELSEGMRVGAGDVIGLVSDVPGHCAPTTCVHWGIRVAGNYIDPLDVLAGYGPVVLLPRSLGARRGTRDTSCGGARSDATA